MADLIDRAALVAELKEKSETEWVGSSYDHKDIRTGMRMALACTEKFPAVDAVPVVRCKDCKHVESVVTPYGERWSCYAWDRYTYPDGYCQEGEFDGERRTDG